MAKLIASGLAGFPHITAFDEVAENRFEHLDVCVVLIYLIDVVDVDALPFLAEQFDVLGVKGYNLAPTDSDKRALIKRSIELHRFKGTPWAVKESLKAIGYYNAIIQERLVSDPIFYDGTYIHNGFQVYGYGHWADFRVILDLGATLGVTAESAAAAKALINEYKNVRSRLRDISYSATVHEYVDATESLVINRDYQINESFGSYYDGSDFYDGTIDHAGDIFETIITTNE